MRDAALALQAVHDRQLVHRDVKPANLMLTPDGSRVVLMDFGLAKGQTMSLMASKAGGLLGTLRYAAPEQLAAATLKVGPAADIRGLGVTLWELLTRRRLFEEAEDEAQLGQMVLSKDVPRLRTIDTNFDRDLEAIVARATERSAVERIGSARQLADYLNLYLDHKPLPIRPPSAGELLRRWMREHKPLVASTAAALATIVLTVVVAFALITHSRNAAISARKIAEHQEAGARAVTKFYEEHVLAAARPQGWEGGVGKDVTLKGALNQAVPTIDKAFEGQPELEAKVRDSLGMTYFYLGDFKAAQPQLEMGYKLRHANLGAEHPETLSSLHNLAMVNWKLGHIKEAISLARQALEKRRQVLGPEYIDTLWTQLNLGLFLSEDSQYNEAETTLRDAIEACKRTLEPNHHHTLYGQNDLAIVLWMKGKHDDSIALDRETLAGRTVKLGADHPDTLRSMGNLANSLELIGQLDEAETLARRSLEARTRVLGLEHEETLWSMGFLGDVLYDKHEFKQAEDLYGKKVEISRRTLGFEHPETLSAEGKFADILADEGKLDEAVPLYFLVVASQRKKLGDGDVGLSTTLAQFGSKLCEKGRSRS